MEKVSLKSKINAIRLELSKEMNKSGKNTYSNYNYFQLKDFMPRAIELMNDNGIYAEYQMVQVRFDLPGKKTTNYVADENGVQVASSVIEEENWEYKEVAILDVYNIDDEEDTIHLEKSTADLRLTGAQPIQNVGGRSTYMKRYLYMDLFEINENDAVEEQTGKPEKVETKTTKTTKPKTTSVATKKTEEVTPADFEPKKEETAVEVNTDELMSMSRKVELANYIKEKGGVPKDVMVDVTKTLGIETATLKESDYDKIKEEIDKKLGGK